MPVGQTALLVASVYVSAAIAQPTMGRLAGLFGGRRVLTVGLVIAAAGGLVGVISVAAQVTIAPGLPLGGLLVGLVGWRAVFAVNVPLAAVGLTQWLQEVRHMSASTAGLVMPPMTGMSIPVVRPFARRNLVRLPLVIVAVGSLAAAVGLPFVDVGTPLVLVVGLTIAAGVTVMLNGLGNQGALYGQTDDTGTAAGLLRTSSYLGAILAVVTFGPSRLPKTIAET